jgi:dsDNA-specific endonuclease/ATPase MutS2
LANLPKHTTSVVHQDANTVTGSGDLFCHQCLYGLRLQLEQREAAEKERLESFRQDMLALTERLEQEKERNEEAKNTVKQQQQNQCPQLVAKVLAGT